MIRTPNKPSKEVHEFATVAEDAKAMCRLLQTYVSPVGKGPEQHYAIHHSQYSTNPYNFFVLNPMLVGAQPTDVIVIVNPKIIEKDMESRRNYRESCMSFPFRPGVKVRRFDKIKVQYQTPTKDGKDMVLEEKEMEGLMAHIFQHELEHARGTHIYAANPARV